MQTTAQDHHWTVRTWPLPALLAWGGAWLVLRTALVLDVPAHLAVWLATALGVALSLWGDQWWRRILIAIGFPLSLLLSQSTLLTGTLPAWAWLVPLGLLLLVYPLGVWRDAPLFPTPLNALDALPQHAPLPEGAAILDAGSGLGDGLRALRRAYPQAQWHGVEGSRMLRLLCALRCPWALVRHGDLWEAHWSPYDMVYLFQRPESMEAAARKAQAELRPGAWLVSLDFEATSLVPNACLSTPGGTMLWLYQAPFVAQQGD